MSADLIAAGDQGGCLAFTIGADPVTCGQDIDIPESTKYLTLLVRNEVRLLILFENSKL